MGAGARYEKAVFAGGCFWCIQAAFDSLEGVTETTAGYTGGETRDPAYEEVSSGRTGHVEAVSVVYDPSRVSYERLLDVFWRNIDPTDDGGQFADEGPQYRTAIFYQNDGQRRLAEASKKALEASGRFDAPIVTEIIPAVPFYPAEEYHQKYHLKNPERYERYSRGSGRTGFVEAVWGRDKGAAKGSAASAPRYERPPDEELKRRLTTLQYKVTRENGTERPFDNEYWDNKRPGIYVDVVSGQPLFSSLDKFDSGTGWPSFTRPLERSSVVEREDKSLGMRRVEVRSGGADSHLGHLFEDGPAPTGMRYCINSAALRFVAAEDLEKEGHPELKRLFEGK